MTSQPDCLKKRFPLSGRHLVNFPFIEIEANIIRCYDFSSTHSVVSAAAAATKGLDRFYHSIRAGNKALFTSFKITHLFDSNQIWKLLYFVDV